MWPDNETDRDFLNFDGVADTVAEIVFQAAGRPISIGIAGAWGVGKSSMIRLIHNAIAKRDKKEQPDYVFVEFNAWLYQGYDDARAALLEVIAETLEREAEKRKTGVDKAREFLKRVKWLRVAKLTVGSAISLGMGLPPTGLLGEVFELGKKAAGRTLDATGLAAGEKAVTKITEEAGGWLKAKEDSSPPKEIQALRDTFEETLSEMGVRLVVLIDDLDRCLPETTISTLEAIRLFLFLKNTAFVIAADDAMVKHAVRRHFEGIEDDELVTSYFDKLIQLPIRVPPLGTQEVRAYMMLLFVENSALSATDKEAIRVGVCKQLGQTWRGQRVDRAYMQTLHQNLPADLIARFDVADRLAPIMASASQIAGNPRLVKRFLNALSVRMAIARTHGVGTDEAVLAKLLLFERCGGAKAYGGLMKAVNGDVEGKARFLVGIEDSASKGEEFKLDADWDTPFAREWMTLPPSLGDLDLRGALYVSREHAPLITPEDRLTSEGAGLLAALLTNPTTADQFRPQLAKLPRTDITTIMDRVLDRARREQEWGVPPILEACLTLVGADSSQATRLEAFLRERPASQVKPNIVPRIGDYPWAAGVFNAWEQAGVTTAVKRAIKQKRDNGNLKV